jgi:flagellar basal-body rod modification protein FlgD
MLIAQLKNQDPLNPVSNDRFAVDLATFSQLEQLIEINSKLEKSADISSSITSFLGKTVVLNSTNFTLTNGALEEGVFVKIEEDFDKLQVNIKNSNGVVVDTKEIKDFSKGRNVLLLDNLKLPDGFYFVEVKGVKGGVVRELKASPAVTVNGFILGDPPILVGGQREVQLREIKEVWQI